MSSDSSESDSGDYEVVMTKYKIVSELFSKALKGDNEAQKRLNEMHKELDDNEDTEIKLPSVSESMSIPEFEVLLCIEDGDLEGVEQLWGNINPSVNNNVFLRSAVEGNQLKIVEYILKDDRLIFIKEEDSIYVEIIYELENIEMLRILYECESLRACLDEDFIKDIEIKLND